MAAPDQRRDPDPVSRRVLRALRTRKNLWRFLCTFCRAVEKGGGNPYLVGGFVRDLVEGRPGKDIDLMLTGMEFGELGRLLRSLPARTLGIRKVLPVGKTFAVYKVRTGWAEEDIDVALARPKRSAGAEGRGTVLRATDVEAREDSARRDFTVNSLLFALRTERNRLTGEIVDFFGGLEDLRRKLIRAVGRPEDRFREDPLRMLRAVRQKNERRGYAIEKKTWEAILRCAPEFFRTIPGDRIIAELLRSLLASPAGSVLDLHRAGILKILLPELYAARKGPARILRRYALLENSVGRPLPEIPLLANLLMDVAECECEERIRRGLPKVRRGRMPALGKAEEKRCFRLSRTDAIARRLRFPQVRTVVRMLEDGNRLAHFHRLKNPHARAEAVLGRWETPGHLLSFYTAARKAAGRKGSDFRPFLRIAARRPPLVSGRDLIRIGIPASPRMEAILEEVREATLGGSVTTRNEAANLALSISGKEGTAPVRHRGNQRPRKESR
jgi:tRNA nucleotidyltransferase/poly(A) polymerase